MPSGFSTTLGIYVDWRAELLDRWGTEVRGAAAAVGRGQPDRLAPVLLTDNGAAYWYRTEVGRTIGTSVAEAVEALRADGVPVRPSSWIRGATNTRCAADRGDRLSGGGAALGPDEVGTAPMPSIHRRRAATRSNSWLTGSAIRRWSSTRATSRRTRRTSRREWRVDELRPTRWTRCSSGDGSKMHAVGVCAIEQDWMLLSWFGVRALRAAPTGLLRGSAGSMRSPTSSASS